MVLIACVAWNLLVATPSEPRIDENGQPSALLALAAQAYHFEPTEAAPSLATIAAEPDESATASAVSDYGRDGSRYWMIRGAAGVGADDGQVGLMGFGFVWFVADDLSLNLEFNGAGFSQEDSDTLGFNVGLILRYHFYVSEDRSFSMYGEGGAGVLFTGSSVPQDGSSFNLNPQIGAGISFDVGDRYRADVGLRWYHVSNANMYEDNPGRDFAMVYAELSFPF